MNNLDKMDDKKFSYKDLESNKIIKYFGIEIKNNLK